MNFNDFTGSELYVYELAKGLIKLGHDVSVCSNIGEPMLSLAHKSGIKMYTLSEPPGFKMGDGKWFLKTNEGDIPSTDKTLYKISDVRFDVMHLNHKPITEFMVKLYPDIPTLCTIHSEVISLEEPVIHETIKKYIAIRQEIKDYIVTRFSIPQDDVTVIHNPIDENRFKVKVKTDKNVKRRVLFVGTIDYLRKNTILDLVAKTKDNNEEFWLVGKDKDNYLNDILRGNEHVKHFKPTLSVENYITQCDEVASILLGRTCIEGWLCGKPSWIYDVDQYGEIKSKELFEPPIDVDKFKSSVVTPKIIDEYIKIIA